MYLNPLITTQVMSKMNTAIVHGVCPVVETPFASDGTVDHASFDKLIDHLLAIGVRSVMFPGFASEFYKLNDDERERLTFTLVERFHRVNGAVVVVSVSDHATSLAVSRARQAVDMGADMVNILPPHLLGPSSEAVRAHVHAVLNAIAPTPAILQYAPAQTGTSLNPHNIAEMAISSPNLVQIKVESTPPGQMISALVAEAPTLECVVGYAGVQLIDGLRRGATAVQPGCSFAEIYLRIWELWQAEDYSSAINLHTKLLPYISYWMLDIELIVRAEKRISMLRGLIATDHCRAPSRLLDGEENAMIERFLEEFAEHLAEPSL
jgi:dihydrodipicolinate synthase/N-acetylneuraminate lyase